MKICSYRTDLYPFRDLGEDILGEPLELLSAADYAEVFTPDLDQSTHYHRRWYASELAPRFLDVYATFVEHLASAVIKEPVVYQKIPTFRVHLPGNLAVGEFHKDSDYGHSSSEVNVWVPLTHALGTNTIHLLLDRRLMAVNLNYGEFLIFDGANTMHGNVINTMSMSRVSFDFRVIPLSQYVDSAEHSVTQHIPFRLGEYWTGPTGVSNETTSTR